MENARVTDDVNLTLALATNSALGMVRGNWWTNTHMLLWLPSPVARQSRIELACGCPDPDGDPCESLHQQLETCPALAIDRYATGGALRGLARRIDRVIALLATVPSQPLLLEGQLIRHCAYARLPLYGYPGQLQHGLRVLYQQDYIDVISAWAEPDAWEYVTLAQSGYPMAVAKRADAVVGCVMPMTPCKHGPGCVRGT